ncbi:hypothetical protein V8E36_001122 [Tilletia maclaganii]
MGQFIYWLGIASAEKQWASQRVDVDMDTNCCLEQPSAVWNQFQSLPSTKKGERKTANGPPPRPPSFTSSSGARSYRTAGAAASSAERHHHHHNTLGGGGVSAPSKTSSAARRCSRHFLPPPSSYAYANHVMPTYLYSPTPPSGGPPLVFSLHWSCPAHSVPSTRYDSSSNHHLPMNATCLQENPYAEPAQGPRSRVELAAGEPIAGLVRDFKGVESEWVGRWTAERAHIWDSVNFSRNVFADEHARTRTN